MIKLYEVGTTDERGKFIVWAHDASNGKTYRQYVWINLGQLAERIENNTENIKNLAIDNDDWTEFRSVE